MFEKITEYVKSKYVRIDCCTNGILLTLNIQNNLED